MAKDYTSLLGRDSGASFGDIAGAYLGGNKKIKNRGRAALLLSMFVNMRESKLRDNVLNNLEELDERQTIALSRGKAAYQKGMKLENQYNDVMSNPGGVFGYYEKDAEEAFNNHLKKLGMDSSLYEGDNPSAAKQKYKFMEDWATERHQNFMKVYNPNALTDISSLGTEEEFLKEIKEGYVAERKNITNPKNLSVVHNLFSKVGIGRKRDKELQDNYEREMKEAQAHEKTYTAFANPIKNVQTIGQNGTPKTAYDGVQRKQILVRANEFDEILSEFNIKKGDSLYDPLRRAIAAVPEKQRTVNAVELKITNGIVQRFATESSYVIDEINQKYKRSFPQLKIQDPNYTMEIHNEKRDKEIRTVIGIPNVTLDIANAARHFASFSGDEFARKNGLDPTKKADALVIEKHVEEELSNYMEKHFADKLGIKTLTQIKQDVLPRTVLDTARLVTLQDPNTITGIEATRINQDILFQYKNSDKLEDQAVYNYIMEDLEGDTVENQEWNIDSKYKTIIFEMKKDSYNSNIIRTAKYNLDVLANKYPTPGYE